MHGVSDTDPPALSAAEADAQNVAYGSQVVTVRPAGDADIDALRRIAATAYGHYAARIGRQPAPMTADYARAVRSGQAWVAADRGEIVGLVILIVRPGHLLLENVAVLPTAQGRGIGSRLLALAEDQARGLQLCEIRLYTNEAMTENLAYCTWRGYAEIHRAEQDGFRRVFFRKQLAG
jgi:GNAT superfamily N-acetyltransferase